MKPLIVIPARYGSTRLPAKPLQLIAGKEMLHRVHDIALRAAEEAGGAEVLIATDDHRIAAFCDEIEAKWVITSVQCPTGTDRVCEALLKCESDATHVINLQGDTPLTPPWFIAALVSEFKREPSLEVVTPVVPLSWNDLDKLREQKKTTPFSGCTVTRGKNGDAFWFSKNIIPAIRNESALRQEEGPSPVMRHIGIYGYRRDILEKYVTLPLGHYEQLEGLEQLRLLENGVGIRTVEVETRGRSIISGVDSPEDVERVEKLLREFGEFT